MLADPTYGALILPQVVAGALTASRVPVVAELAEAASRTDRSGGPYRYAVDAFGPLVGFAVGWITMVSSLLGYAAVARGFAEHAAFLVGGAGNFAVEAGAVVAIVGALALVNIVGIKPSARTGQRYPGHAVTPGPHRRGRPHRCGPLRRRPPEGRASARPTRPAASRRPPPWW